MEVEEGVRGSRKRMKERYVPMLSEMNEFSILSVSGPCFFAACSCM